VGGGDEFVHAQVAFGRGVATQGHGLGRAAHVQRRGVRVGIDGDGGHTHAVRGALDAQGDFASVGD
jgi:hypothetical protein